MATSYYAILYHVAFHKDAIWSNVRLPLHKNNKVVPKGAEMEAEGKERFIEMMRSTKKNSIETFFEKEVQILKAVPFS